MIYCMRFVLGEVREDWTRAADRTRAPLLTPTIGETQAT